MLSELLYDLPSLILLPLLIVAAVILWVFYNNLQNRINILQMQIQQLRKQVESLLVRQNVNNQIAAVEKPITSEIKTSAKTENSLKPQPEVKHKQIAKTESETIAQSKSASNVKPISPTQKSKLTQKPAQVTKPSSDGFLQSRFMQWVIKGNPVSKIAIIILFFGLSYLLKFSIDHGLMSPEIRILGSLALGMILLGLGWKLRHKKALYALILQGGAIGILYITLFAAYKLYELVPFLLTFALLIIVCATSILFAILQRTISLAIIACVGGYLAPVLLSTGGGNHIALFSYYLLISSAILIISFWQSWRLLNLIGFVFTFVVAILWGYRSFKAEFYIECQLFILANLLIYGILAVLLSIRNTKQEPLQSLFDLTLLFSVPLTAFALQYAITEHWQYAPAYSALGFGLIYLLGSFAVLKIWQGRAKQLALFGLAIGLGFSTLAVPLALTINWTALIWLFEGTALTYIALQLRQVRFSWFGTIVVLLGVIWGQFGNAVYHMDNTQFITGFAILSAIMLFNACLWYKYREIHSSSVALQILFLMLALISWSQLIILGVNRVVDSQIFVVPPILICFTIAVWIWYLIGRKLNWQLLRLAVIALWPILALSLIHNIALYIHSINSGIWIVSWLMAFISAYLFLYFNKNDLVINQRLAPALHVSLLWIIFGWLLFEINGLSIHMPWGYSIILHAALMAIASGIILMVLVLTKYKRFPVNVSEKLYLHIALLPVGVYLLFKLLMEVASSGQILHWSYIPIINPLEEAAIFTIIVLIGWKHFAFKALKNHLRPQQKPLQNGLNLVIIFMIFLWGNSVILRSLSEWLHLNWSAYALWHENIVQVVISLVWTIVAVISIAIAHRYALRKLWFAGAILQAIVVLKLVIVDSVELEGLMRAFVFIGVALLMLVIGYLAPLPPKIQTAKKLAAKDSTVIDNTVTESNNKNNQNELE